MSEKKGRIIGAIEDEYVIHLGPSKKKTEYCHVFLYTDRLVYKICKGGFFGSMAMQETGLLGRAIIRNSGVTKKYIDVDEIQLSDVDRVEYEHKAMYLYMKNGDTHRFHTSKLRDPIKEFSVAIQQAMHNFKTVE